MHRETWARWYERRHGNGAFVIRRSAEGAFVIPQQRRRASYVSSRRSAEGASVGIYSHVLVARPSAGTVDCPEGTHTRPLRVAPAYEAQRRMTLRIATTGLACTDTSAG